MNKPLLVEAALTRALLELVKGKRGINPDTEYRLPSIPKLSSKNGWKGQEMNNGTAKIAAMASLLGVTKEAGIKDLLSRVARSGAALPIAGGISGLGLAAPDVMRDLEEGNRGKAIARAGIGTAVGTGVGFLGKGLARSAYQAKSLGKTNAALQKYVAEGKGATSRLQSKLEEIATRANENATRAAVNQEKYLSTKETLDATTKQLNKLREGMPTPSKIPVGRTPKGRMKRPVKTVATGETLSPEQNDALIAEMQEKFKR